MVIVVIVNRRTVVMVSVVVVRVRVHVRCRQRRRRAEQRGCEQDRQNGPQGVEFMEWDWLGQLPADRRTPVT
jgi:hypothetical protein